jgi:signal transduction histidine kinase
MRERTQALGGQFEIEAAAGRGTQVVVRIPH